MALRHARLAALSAFAVLLAGPAAAEIKTVGPETVGLSAEGLAAFEKQMHAYVDEGKLAGVTTLVSRHGKVAHLDVYGKQDLATGALLKADSIFRIASMTKPVTGVAMMILYEEGKWKLDDPVAKHIPEFAGLKVKGPDGQLAEQKTPMTMAQLMSHTAGFGTSAVYDDEPSVWGGDLRKMVTGLSKLPLASQPGTDWAYGPSVNIQGYVVEKLSGQSLNEFFESRIFNPLKMADTGFWVDPAKVSRVVAINTYKDGKLVPADPSARPALTSKPVFLSGSGGLFSTVEDYWRFAQMLAGGGELEGARILKPETVKLMRTSVLEPGVQLDLYGTPQPGLGFGMDFAVLQDPAAAKSPQGQDSYYWGGAFGTWFWIDPTNDLIVVGLIQNLNGTLPWGGTPPMGATSAQLVYAALEAPAK